MSERFYGGRKFKKPSQKEIEEMKKNMKKVKKIEKKARIYHQEEIKNIESLLEQIH